MNLVKIKKYLSPKKCLAIMGLGLLIAAGIAHPLGAQTVTTSYGSDEPLQRGMIVGLNPEDTAKVMPLDSDNKEYIHGIVVDANQSPVTLSTEGQQVFIASTGRHEVLVSSQNGEIVVGDLLSVSALPGIGMKTDQKAEYVVGKALANFNGQDNVLSEAELTDGTGNKRKVGIGRIPMDISVARNPMIRPKEPDLPEFLQRISENIAHKPVSSIRLYSALAVLLATTITSIALIYGSVKGSIHSLGRNPLSKKVIFRGMFQVIIVGIMIFISGIFGVYLVLRL